MPAVGSATASRPAPPSPPSCARPHPRVRTAFPSPAGGIKVERVAEVLDFYGPDCLLLVGGSLYEAGDALVERTRELVERLARAASAESVP